MKFNLYQELQKCPVFPIKYSTANIILNGSSQLAALSLFGDYKKHKASYGFFLRKKLSIDDPEQTHNTKMEDFALTDFASSSLSSLLTDEVDAAKSDEDETMQQTLQWLR
jgi:hypothetical protein